MKNLYKIILGFSFLAILSGFFIQTAEAKRFNLIKVIFGTRCHPNSTGTGCEGDKGCCFIGSADGIVTENTGTAEISIIKGGILLNIIEDRSPAKDYENTFYIYSPIAIPREQCTNLGYKSIILQPGKYAIDKSTNPLGKVKITATIQS